MSLKRIAVLVGLLTLDSQALGECVWSHIDHKVSYNDSGPWNPNTYRRLETGLMVADVTGALWEGSESHIGRTMWQGVDSVLLAGLGAAAGKRIFTRARPTDGTPCDWFQGGSHYSFPSEEAAMSAALVTPYVLEYGKDYPAVYGLAALPLYIGTARVKNQRHWQTDVVAGWAIGSLAGAYSHNRELPLIVSILPNGITIGISKRF